MTRDGVRSPDPGGGPTGQPVGEPGGSRHPLLRPTWLVAHAIVLTVLVTFPQLGLWQWDRYREEQALDDRLQDRLDAAPVPLSEVLPPRIDAITAADLEFTPVVVTGTWLADEQVAQRRSLAGSGGFDLLTPLSLDDGAAVLVRRGWVPPAGGASAEPTSDRPTAGPVRVIGFLERSGRQPGGLGARDADQGELDVVFHADVDRLDGQVTGELLPMVVHLTAQVPGDGDLPQPQPPPRGDPAQNLSYALQWWSFTAIVGIGYLVVLRRRLRDHRAGVDTDTDPLLRRRVAP